MWGDPDRAACLQGNDMLATLLFQISSPAHIPWGDPRWQELLHGYDVWVHMEDSGDTESSAIISKACQNMAKHATVSSNLAALCLHVTRMLRQLVRDIQRTTDNSGEDPTVDFSARISRVGKARATAGALQLLRLLCHPVVVACGGPNAKGKLDEALLYHTRGDLPCDQPAGRPLVHSIMDLVTVVGSSHEALETPEIYDAVVLSFHLFFVLCGTQLYQPFVSSFDPQESTGQSKHHYVLQELFREETAGDTVESRNFRLFYASSRSSFSQTSQRETAKRQHIWTPKTVLATCLDWQIRRPPAPERSISRYFYAMAEAAVAAKGGQRVAPDGMYESHLVVNAVARDVATTGVATAEAMPANGISNPALASPARHNVIMDATRGVITIGSSIILLPFRLVSLVFGVITSSNRSRNSRENTAARKFSQASSRTRDVLWLSESHVADLGSCLILLLANNQRNGYNPFRQQLMSLVDNRWEDDKEPNLGLPDLPPLKASSDLEEEASLSVGDVMEDDKRALFRSIKTGSPLTINFENLFHSFGRSLHTEVGALMLYTMFQSSPAFANNLGVRSDLDTLVLPLLRTLYFSSSTKTYEAVDYAKADKSETKSHLLDIRSCPFRSPSQLYVILILLLLFSQDASFGRDAFRRIQVGNVVWYKERHLRNINLGSVLLLTLLRSLLFNLHRLQDPFLLSNCCACLMNLSPSVVDLHEYAAMRLASVTLTVLKRQSKMKGSAKVTDATNGSEKDSEASTPYSMYEEVSETLLGMIQRCLSGKNIERNLHLVYALVYNQTDYLRIFHENPLFPSKIAKRIEAITHEASTIIQERGAHSASIALKVLEEQSERLQKVAEGLEMEHLDEFTFAYEEEADPEVFFVPYVWETISCVVTSSSIEWKKDDIKAFALLDPVEVNGDDEEAPLPVGDFSPDVDDVV